MTKRTTNKQRASKKQEKATWIGFYEHHLTPTDKDAIKELDAGTAEAMEYLTSLASLGYRVSVTWHTNMQAHIATAYGYWAGCANAGLSLSCIHKDASTAVVALGYLVEVVYGKDEWGETSAKASGYDW